MEELAISAINRKADWIDGIWHLACATLPYACYISGTRHESGRIPSLLDASAADGRFVLQVVELNAGR